MSLIVDQFDRMVTASAAGGQIGWEQIAESGFLDLLVPEEAGGAGLPISEAFPLALLLGRRGIDLPVVETMIGRALLGADAPTGMMVLSDRRPWRDAVAQRALVVVGSVGRSSLMGWEVRAQQTPARLTTIAAASMAARMAGTMQAVTDMTIHYALVRKQFGREIARFQAVQQQIAVMAEETAAAAMAASASFRGELEDFSENRAAVAKLRACQAAEQVSSIGHAVHGAIGVSREYVLGRHTAQLRSWSMAFGGRSYWEARLGASVLRGQGGFLDAIRFAPVGN